MESIKTFLADNKSTLIAAIRDGKLTESLSNLSTLTVTEFNCLRYILASSYGLDIWGWGVADEENNPSDIEANMAEYNVVDMDTINGFYPFSSKLVTGINTGKLTDIYKKINDSFGLFTGSIFSGYTNPLSVEIQALIGSTSLTGEMPEVMTTRINALLKFVHKDLKVITA